jgi:hypothetical protein
MAEKRLADLHRRRKPVEKCDLLGCQRRPRRLDYLRRRAPLLARRELTVGVAAQPAYPLAERAEALERLRRIRSTRADIAAHDHRRLVRDLRQHSLQSTQVPVDVVKGRDRRLSHDDAN